MKASGILESDIKEEEEEKDDEVVVLQSERTKKIKVIFLFNLNCSYIIYIFF